jgi:hypothetical protein
MRRLRVCIYGGTDLGAASISLISAIAYQVLHLPSAVIVTGGFLHGGKKPGAMSTDSAALMGARRFAREEGRPLSECYEAWIPEPGLDSRPDVKGVVRMTEADGIKVEVMHGRTPLGRRLAMVANVDVVITIAGSRHTEVVIEQALELGVPVFPIPFADGDSEALLEKYRDRIESRFEPGGLDRCLGEVSRAMKRDPESAAGAVVDLLETAKVGRCLVLFQYDDEHDRLYTSVVEPAISPHMFPVRMDRIPASESIYTSFAELMRTSSAVIADITRINEDVMYEVGYAHGRGLKPLLYTRDHARLDTLPVYFRTLNVLPATEATLPGIVDGYLRSVKALREEEQLPA